MQNKAAKKDKAGKVLMQKIRRDLQIIFSAIWKNLALFMALLFTAAALLRRFGADADAGWWQLVLDALNMATMERVETGGKAVPIVLAFTLPVGMAVILGEGILRVFTIYMNRGTNRKEWDLMVAKSLKEHTVICGVGEMGKQLLREMLKKEQELDIVLVDPRPGIMTELGLSDEYALHFQSDMSDVDTLEQANIRAAKQVILCAGDDALNLETAYKILHMNPDVPVWIRLHHAGLAELMDLSRLPNIHFFCPYEQAAKVIVKHVMKA